MMLVEVPSIPGNTKQATYWKCLAPGCNQQCIGKNATKALAHGSRNRLYCVSQHVKPCRGNASQAEIDLFGALLEKKQNKKQAAKRGSDLVAEDIVTTQLSVSEGWAAKKAKPSAGFASMNASLSVASSELTTPASAGRVQRQLDLVSAFSNTSIAASNSADLDAAIANMVYCKALPFSFGECPYFQRVLDIARFAPMGYKAPKRMTLAGDMLDLSYKVELQNGFAELLVDADVFGVAIFGDAATIHKCPLVNLFASSFHVPAMLVDIVDCSSRLLEGQKKDGTFISSLFLPLLEKLDALKDRTDIVFFDGGSNFQLAGRIMQAAYPRMTVVHGLEHVLSLVFEDIAKIKVVRVSVLCADLSFAHCTHYFVQLLTLQVKRLYRCFGSGSNHKPYAFFIAHSKQFNKGRAVGLLRTTETRFASFFYSMHRALRCRSALEATVHSVAWKDLKRQKPFINRAAEDVKDDMFWKRIFFLLRALYPLLKLLRMADSNKPNMDKVCFYLNLTREHLVKSRDDLCREDIFPSSYEITKEVEADASYDDDEDDEESSDDSDDGGADFTLEEEDQDVYTVDDEWGTLISEQTKGIFQPIMDAIVKRTPKILHDFAYTAYVCSVRSDIVQDAKRRIEGNGAVRIQIENCVRRLLCHDVDGSVDGTIDIKTDQFWDELKHFQNR